MFSFVTPFFFIAKPKKQKAVEAQWRRQEVALVGNDTISRKNKYFQSSVSTSLCGIFVPMWNNK